MAKKEKSGIPEWIGNTPFPPNKKKPTLVTEPSVVTVYGMGNERISPRVWVSTDKILISEWVVPPGQSFKPADIHGGDEPYYVAEGIATIVNHETGQVTEAKEGDCMLIPANCWHLVYNFTDEPVRIVAIIAGKVWEEGQKEEVEQQEVKPRYYNAGG